MRFPALLQLARGLTAPPSNSGDPSGSLVYQVFGCVQSRGVNLEATPQPAMHRFAVMNADVVDEDVLQILDAARALGALSPVKLIDVREAFLYLFLDAKVSSSTFAAIESLWLSFLGGDANQRWAVRFASESEIFTGRSDYDFWAAARKILESEALGLTLHTLPVHDTPITENYEHWNGAVVQQRPQQSDQCHIPHSIVPCLLSDIQTRLGHRGVKTIDRYLNTFEYFFNSSQSHAPHMVGRCLTEPNRYPTEPNRWPNAECAKCGYAIITMPSKHTDAEANIPR